MKKFFLSCMMALVAMCGLNSCSEDCDHVFIEHDFTQDIVGTWTFLNGDLAEAMVIKADGSFTTTGVARGGSMYEEKGTIKVENNKVTLSFDGDKETFEGRLEFVAGKSLSIVMFDDNDVRLTYDYCEEDLSDEVVGMWVCNEGVAGMIIQSYQNDGKSIFTGFSLGANDYMTNMESTYEVVGDLMFQKTGDMYFVTRLVYVPNKTQMGDILHTTSTILVNDAYVTSSYSFLRVKQGLNLTGKAYAYSSAYVTNAKGTDEDFSIMGHTFNMAKIKASDFDVILGANLFCVELNANSITHKYRPNGQDEVFDAPITVEGNKVTLDMSAVNPVLREVVMYMYQDKDDCQLHMYMPTSSFVNYFANLEIVTLLSEGKLDPTDSAAVEKFFADMEARIESINVSFVMKAIEK